MPSYDFTIQTESENFYNITAKVTKAVQLSGIRDGICVIYCPHTTAGITINENADPDVVSDMLLGLRKTFPDLPQYRHMEGNTTAHLKASTIGASATVIIENGTLVLGRWQGIYFCEFDGPRSRRFFVKVLGDK
jgi:secondary thiamine-phosphate synthase enzyme